MGELDISLYRDDVAARGSLTVRSRLAQPEIKGTNLPFSIDDLTIVLVDDVLSPGAPSAPPSTRSSTTADRRAFSWRVLVDRGHRELPIRPDFVGKNLPTSQGERINVRLSEVDGEDEIVLEATREGVES